MLDEKTIESRSHPITGNRLNIRGFINGLEKCFNLNKKANRNRRITWLTPWSLIMGLRNDFTLAVRR